MTPTPYSRQFEIERASVDPEAGTFEAVLFTDGEASDGHILNIKGGRVPDKFPMFVNHSADPTTQLGSLHYTGKSEHEVRVRGEVFTEGVGAPLEVRQDLLAKMAAGHVSRMSGRWDAKDKDAKRRINLPSDHPAFVDDSKETEYRKKWGLYFEKWWAMEGSIVGLGADPQAVMRWASDEGSPDCVREFWRGQVPEAQVSGIAAAVQASIRDAIEAGVDPDVITSFLPAEDPTLGSEHIAPFLSESESVPAFGEVLERVGDLETGIERLEPLEANLAEIAAAIKKRLDAVDASLAELAKPAPTATEVQERVDKGDPLPPTQEPREIFAELRSSFEALREEAIEKFRAEVAKARGRVTHE